MLTLVLLVVIPALAAAGACLRAWPGRVFSAGAPLVVFLWLLTLAPDIVRGEPVSASVTWMGALDIELALRLDGWSLIFALLISGIGTLVLFYAGSYMEDPAARQRLEPLLLLFMSSMLAAVMADDLITLYAAWELTGITSFMLIGFDHERDEARKAAQQALVVTVAGGLAMLAGFTLLAIEGGTWRISELMQPGVVDLDSWLTWGAFAGVVAGAVTKSAQFPFHGWLPGAMAAPTPVSAYLHSATMVKLGIYLLGRMHPALGGLAAWTILLPIFGVVTMAVGAVLAVREDDAKRVLAYSTVSALGSMVLLLGIGTPAAMKALIVVLVAHGLYKASLFLIAGAIDHGTHTRSLARLGGLRRYMPWTGLAALIAAASLAGLPPTAGYLAKEAFIDASDDAAIAIAVAAAIVGASALQVVVAGLIGWHPFSGGPRDLELHPHEVSPRMWAPPTLLALLGLVGGFAFVLWPLPVETAAAAVTGERSEVRLYLWPGLGRVVFLSALAIALGVVAYWQRTRLLQIPWPVPSAERLFAAGLAGVTWVGQTVDGRLQNGSMPRYVTITLLTVAIPTWVLLARHGTIPSLGSGFDSLDGVILPALLIASALAAAFAPTRLQAIIALGAAGFVMALIFATYHGPDLAMTQVLVDTLTVVLLLSAFRFLPITRSHVGRVRHSRDLIVAGTFGVAMASLTWVILTTDGQRPLTEFFGEESVASAYGRNVVNTILVDFRSIDTLGEITVLAVAAIGVIALLAGPAGEPLRSREVRTPSLVLITTTQFLMSLLLVFAAFLLLRGHNEPGGGFVAGLVATVAFVLYAMAYGLPSARRVIGNIPVYLIGLGLTIAGLSGVIGPLQGNAPLSGEWTYVAGIHIGSPLLFDLGVFAVVLGVAVSLLLTLSEAQPDPEPELQPEGVEA